MTPETTDPRIAEIRARWIDEDGDKLDWSLRGSAERGQQAVKDIVTLLDALTVLRRRTEEAESKSRIDEDSYNETLKTAMDLAEQITALRQRVEELTQERDGWRTRFGLQTSNGWQTAEEASELHQQTYQASGKLMKERLAAAERELTHERKTTNDALQRAAEYATAKEAAEAKVRELGEEVFNLQLFSF